MSTLAGKPRLRCLVLAIVSVAGVAGWQALTVHYNFGGNWTALFYTGAAFHPVPPGLAAEHIYVFPNSAGYDGQIYHYLAHDPLFRRNFAAYVDEPRYRGRRILVPGLAFLLALGHDGGIDRAYLAVIWMCTGWGVYWLGRLAQVRGYPEWLGLGFVLTPAVLVSIDRLTVDVALAACCVRIRAVCGRGCAVPVVRCSGCGWFVEGNGVVAAGGVLHLPSKPARLEAGGDILNERAPDW